ncbi:MAG: radical SAM-associated putative lipoprotein [Prevotella sp.]|nr:radical SAM-associated putative lipoprotein [Prevotella sp.]
MKVRFYRWYNAVLTALLSMLGYGCTSDEPDMYGTPVAEYGVPYATYMVEGTVTDEANNPIQGIKTSIKGIFPNGDKVYVDAVDSVLSDASGKYQLRYRGMDRPDYKLTVEDIDGEANGGEFLSDTLDIEYGKAVKVKNGDGAWNGGEYMIQQPVRLKKKP